MYCSKCGYENKHGVAFCSSCGAKMESQKQNSSDQEPYGDNQALTPEVAAAERQSVASLVMGIISLVAGFGLVVGIILGSLAISRGKKARLVLNDKNHNFYVALAGVITGSIGLAVSIFFTIYWTIIITVIATAV